MTVDAVTLEVLRHALEGVADEMGAVLRRTAYSPNIKEREDCSAAVFSSGAELVAQAEHIPVHLGSMPASVDAALRTHPGLARGDQVLLNDPFSGGTHLNDLTLVSPVFTGDVLLGYVANRAHHTDVGGIAPGSIPAGATDISQEGVRIPPVMLYRGGVLDEDTLALVTKASRTPDERIGDLLAQGGANARGATRLAELAAHWGTDVLFEAERALADYADARVRAALDDLAHGEWSFTDYLDDDGAGNGPIAVRCTLRISDVGVEIDLSDSDPQTAGNVNAVEAVAVSAACFVLRCLVPTDVPVNAGCWRVLRVVAPEGTVVNARPPAAVGAGNVEGSQRICDAIFGAFALAAPDRVPAASQGTMNNLLIGGTDASGRAFSYYETIAGGQGGTPWSAGASAVHTNMTNTLNTPVEALEHAYPLRARRYEIREGSGGRGRHDGGDGVVREVEVLASDATVTLITERRSRGPWGVDGGEPGAPGRNAIDGEELPAKVTRGVEAGAVIRIETPGGGGWGKPG
ncbi:MAG TPA: hydantoinase B/oxoprolinase family protein [Actinomycetota bacterium]|jgi:N-methylhydantoinase B|nr:hydantoinase B/oxoprolinase family protein [Actinomycetota bacterium]